MDWKHGILDVDLLRQLLSFRFFAGLGGSAPLYVSFIFDAHKVFDLIDFHLRVGGGVPCRPIIISELDLEISVLVFANPRSVCTAREKWSVFIPRVTAGTDCAFFSFT
ncbi:uncharacterized protein BJ212DRAFT_1576379 [Suillus subaureus]|uniref:Uncharacterized protein n=1 Tax=Suillus subaureus TaxID=48587 RepID=A0A9P7EE31_9AGAM|nr:uncharacterized protein BJ212DRAFT_1576379 [Suillus subaureus]KAG1818694.1 hypothetical protein BJ212DRAFT_1576379 [Suillus subaureus]